MGPAFHHNFGLLHAFKPGFKPFTPVYISISVFVYVTIAVYLLIN